MNEAKLNIKEETSAKKTRSPPNMEIGSVHVLKNFNITPILLIRDAK